MGATINFVLVLGMQRYSEDLFRRAEAEVRNSVKEFRMQVFQDGDVLARPAAVEAAIAAADCVFLSLIHFTDTSEPLVQMIETHDPAVVLGFESVPEVMKLNKVGGYAMKGGKGMPKPVQNVARLLVGGRQEDTLYGYVKLQKITSRLLNFLPGKKLNDFRNWTNISNYWTHRSVANTANMFKLIIREYLGRPQLAVEQPVQPSGCAAAVRQPRRVRALGEAAQPPTQEPGSAVGHGRGDVVPRAHPVRHRVPRPGRAGTRGGGAACAADLRDGHREPRRRARVAGQGRCRPAD